MAILDKTDIVPGNQIKAKHVIDLYALLTGTAFDNFIPNGIKMYFAFMYQFQTNDPTLMEIFNNTGINPIFTRVNTGIYESNSFSAYPQEKVFPLIHLQLDAGQIIPGNALFLHIYFQEYDRLLRVYANNDSLQPVDTFTAIIGLLIFP